MVVGVDVAPDDVAADHTALLLVVAWPVNAMRFNQDEFVGG